MASAEDELRRYVEQTAGIRLTDASVSRVLAARETGARALRALAVQSQFDTEPDKLHTVLESLAADERA